MVTVRKQNADDVEGTSAPMMEYSHCDSYYVNRTKFTYWSVYDGLADTLLVNLIVFLLMLLVFSLLRKSAWNYGRLALIRRSHSRLSSYLFGVQTADVPRDTEVEGVDDELSRTDRGFFSWIPCLLKLTDEQLSMKCGVDAVHYQKFQRYLLVYLAASSVLCLCIILPINISQGTYEGLLNNFARTTISNLHPNSPFLWIHCVLALVMLVMAVGFMAHFSNNILLEYDEETSDTLMVSNMLPDRTSSESLRQHFQEAYPEYSVVDIKFAFNVTRLIALERERLTAEEGLLNSEEMRRLSGESPTMFPYVCGSCCCCSCCRHLGCVEVDSIEFYSMEAERLKSLAEVERTVAVRQNIGVAFITFDDASVAARVKNDFARSCFRSHNPTPSSISGDLHIRDWIVSYAPAPDDILWENLSVSRSEVCAKVVFVNCLLVLVLSCLASPSLFLNQINKLKPIAAIASSNSLLENVLPSILLSVFSSLLPLIVYKSDSAFIPHWTKSRMHGSCMRKTYIFLLLTVLMLPSLGLSSINAAFQYFATAIDQPFHLRWSCIFVANNMAFFARYVISVAFIGLGFELLRLPELLLLSLKLCCARSDAEKSWIEKMMASPFLYGCHYAWMLSIFTVVMVYGVACPLIMPIGLFYMLLKYYIDRYNIYFAYRPSKINRRIHMTAINFVVISLFILQLMLLIFIVLRADNMKSVNIFAVVELSVVLVILCGNLCCAFLHPYRYIRMGYKALSNKVEETTTSAQHSAVTDQARTYLPPVLLEPSIDGVQNSLFSHNQSGAGSTWHATNYGSL